MDGWMEIRSREGVWRRGRDAKMTGHGTHKYKGRIDIAQELYICTENTIDEPSRNGLFPSSLQQQQLLFGLLSLLFYI